MRLCNVHKENSEHPDTAVHVTLSKPNRNPMAHCTLRERRGRTRTGPPASDIHVPWPCVGCRSLPASTALLLQNVLPAKSAAGAHVS